MLSSPSPPLVGGTPATWPHLLNYTVDRAYSTDQWTQLKALWSPTSKIPTHENAYWHMLQLRTVQPKGAHGHIGFNPSQSFEYFWMARQLATQMQLSTPPSWPTVCEVGFGTGMSTAILATATSSATSSLLGGGTHHIFDCRYCAGTAGGKRPAWQYLEEVFGTRLQYHEGLSPKTMANLAKTSPASCDMISIDGSHKYPDVLRDIEAAHALAHKGTVLMFDDCQNPQINRSIVEGVEAGLIAIRHVFNAEAVRLCPTPLHTHTHRH